MKKLSSYEVTMRELTKMKKKYEKEEANKERREAAKNERAVNNLAKMKDFALYSDDDKFDALIELNLKPSYDEGGNFPEWN
jgi:alpha-D-ribose 1-methylphosphonate 5-triphosphate diphosphatase PhnM